MFGISQPSNPLVQAVQCESPFIRLGFHLAPLCGPRLFYDTKLKLMSQSGSKLQLVSRKNDVAMAGGATDASISADRPLPLLKKASTQWNSGESNFTPSGRVLNGSSFHLMS